MKMNPWQVTTDPKSLRRLGKTIEEMGELIAVLGRVIIQGIDSVDPSSGDTNDLRLRKETADVYAQLGLCIEQFGLSKPAIAERIAEKQRQMAEWESHFPSDTCEHGVRDGDWCEPCNREYKEADRLHTEPEGGVS